MHEIRLDFPVKRNEMPVGTPVIKQRKTVIPHVERMNMKALPRQPVQVFTRRRNAMNLGTLFAQGRGKIEAEVGKVPIRIGQ